MTWAESSGDPSGSRSTDKTECAFCSGVLGLLLCYVSYINFSLSCPPRRKHCTLRMLFSNSAPCNEPLPDLHAEKWINWEPPGEHAVHIGHVIFPATEVFLRYLPRPLFHTDARYGHQ